MSRTLWGWLLLLGSVIAPVQAQTAVEYIHTDALGSPVAVTNAAGQVVERIDYEPYGATIGKVVDGVGYAGHVMDGITGLTYMQQRYYDPQLGEFLSVDPVTAYQQPITNFCRYCYARNNPYSFTDPDGRQSKAAGKEIGRWARALWDNKGDFDKAQAQVERQHEMDRKVADTIVDFTALGPVKDAVEVTVKVANSEDAMGQGVGAVAGEITGQITEKVLDGKIGGGAASVAGATVGEIIGDTIEATVDRSRGSNSPSGSAGSQSEPVKPPEPVNLRDKR